MNRKRISVLFTTLIILVITMAMMAGCGLDLKFRKKVEGRGWSYTEMSRIYLGNTEGGNLSKLDIARITALLALEGNLEEHEDTDEEEGEGKSVRYGKYVDKSTFRAIKKMRLMALMEKDSNGQTYQVIRFEFDDAIAALKYYNVAKKSLKEETELNKYLMQKQLTEIKKSIAKVHTKEKKKELQTEAFRIQQQLEEVGSKSKQIGAKLSGKVVTIGSNESIAELMRDSK